MYVTICAKLSDPNLKDCRELLRRNGHTYAVSAVAENHMPYSEFEFPFIKYQEHFQDLERVQNGMPAIREFVMSRRQQQKPEVITHITKQHAEKAQGTSSANENTESYKRP